MHSWCCCSFFGSSGIDTRFCPSFPAQWWQWWPRQHPRIDTDPVLELRYQPQQRADVCLQAEECRCQARINCCQSLSVTVFSRIFKAVVHVNVSLDCSGTAQAYFTGSRFAQLAETYGYVVIFPSSVSYPIPDSNNVATTDLCYRYSLTPAPAGMCPPTRPSRTTVEVTLSVLPTQLALPSATGALTQTESSPSALLPVL